MTKTLTQAAALVLAAVVTATTFGAADAMATGQYAQAGATVSSRLPVLAMQRVVVVGHRV
jgi:hypothetical protein